MDVFLHEIVRTLAILPRDAYEVGDLGEVPAELRRIIAVAKDIGQSCCCWRDEKHHHYLFLAEMSPQLSKRRGATVLHVDEYDERGLRGSSSWIQEHAGKWRRCDEPPGGG